MSSTASAGAPRTVVYQSYRTRDVPAWIATCMHTVRAWAASRGFDYRFIDGRLFDRALPGSSASMRTSAASLLMIA
jgi:hypothetical protein